MRHLILFATTCVLAFPICAAHAQTMYKCVGLDGRISYADQPCRGKVAARKEIDVRANLDDVERASRKQAEREERERLLREGSGRDADAPNAEPAKRTEKEPGARESSPADRGLAEYARLQADTQKRVKADEEARAEASRLWNCRRGPAPEKCQ